MPKKKKKKEEEEIIEDDDFLDDDELEDEDEIEDDDDDDKDEDDDFLPGKYKTSEDAKKGIKDQQKYIKKLEKRLKDSEKDKDKPADDKPAEEDEIDDETILTNPKESIKQMIADESKKNRQENRQENAYTNYAILKDKASVVYPDFDITLNEDAISKYITKYSPEHRRDYGFEVLCEAIEHLGGKKGTSSNADDGVPSEDGSTPAPKGKKGSISKKIADSVLNAELSTDPLQGAFD